MTRRTPLVPVALALMAGIAAQHLLCGVGTAAWWCLAAAAALSLGIALTASRRLNRGVTIAAILLLAAGVGGSLGRHSDPLHNPAHWTRHCGDKAYLTLRLTETPAPYKRSIRAEARVEAVDGRRTDGTLRLFLRPDSAAKALSYGDRLLVHGYPDRNKGFIYTTSDHYIVTGHDGGSLRGRSERLRMRLLERMRRGPLERDNTGVAAALTLGWKADLEPETKAAFQDAGIAHLLAVSGLHVGLLTMLISAALFWLPKVRKGRAVKGTVQLLAVWGFTLLTGAAPSTMRAALMFSMFIVSDMLNRRTPKMNLLAFTAIVTLAADPMLLYNVGWQLSYSAVAGILLARPVIGLYRNCLWKAAAASTAATLATLPVTLATFHSIHPYFLIANVLIVPLASFILGFSLAYMAVPCGFTASLLHWPLVGMRLITNWVSSLPGATIEVYTSNGIATAALATVVTAMLLAAKPLAGKKSA